MASIVWNRSCRALLSSCLLLPLVVAGQEPSDRLVITGQVIDMRTGLPLPAANVMIGALETGSASDDSGYYRIDIPISSHQGEQVDLTVRYIGYSTVTLPVVVAAGTTGLSFFLSPAAVPLEETVVTAPRTEIARGSPSQTFNGEELRETGASNVFEAIEGRVPGLVVLGGTGTGSSPVLLFRGHHYLRETVSEYALIVVDGTPFSLDPQIEGKTRMAQGKTLREVLIDTMTDINFSNIESIEVVRGPGAFWRYGSRAAKGAIIITTKSAASNY